MHISRHIAFWLVPHRENVKLVCHTKPCRAVRITDELMPNRSLIPALHHTSVVIEYLLLGFIVLQLLHIKAEL